jgi:hypothetical protein
MLSVDPATRFSDDDAQKKSHTRVERVIHRTARDITFMMCAVGAIDGANAWNADTRGHGAD